MIFDWTLLDQKVCDQMLGKLSNDQKLIDLVVKDQIVKIK
jgi:hypothetical protein